MADVSRLRKKKQREGQRSKRFLYNKKWETWSVQPWSYGCTREVAKHERSVRVARGQQLLIILAAADSISRTTALQAFFSRLRKQRDS